MTQEERCLVDCSPRPVSIPIVLRTPLGQLNFVRGRKIGIDSEVPIVEAIACDTAKTGQAETDQKNRRPFFQAMIAEFRKPGAVFSMKQESIEGEYAYILRTAEFGAPFAPLGAGPRVLRVALEEPIGFSSSRSSNSRQNLTPIHLSSELEEQHEIESRRCSTRPRFDLHDARRLFDKWPVPSPSHRPLW